MKFTSKFNIFVKIGCLPFALALFENHLPFCVQKRHFQNCRCSGHFFLKMPDGIIIIIIMVEGFSITTKLTECFYLPASFQ